VQTNRVCQYDVWRFCKNNSDSSLESFIVTRVELIGKKRDSSRVITTSFLNVTRVESLARVTPSLYSCHSSFRQERSSLFTKVVGTKFLQIAVAAAAYWNSLSYLTAAPTIGKHFGMISHISSVN